MFLENDVTRAERIQIRRAIERLEVVAGVTYVSRDNAFREFRRLYSDQPALLENIRADNLQASFRVEVTDEVEGPKQVRTALEDAAGVDEITPNPDSQSSEPAR